MYIYTYVYIHIYVYTQTYIYTRSETQQPIATRTDGPDAVETIKGSNTLQHTELTATHTDGPDAEETIKGTNQPILALGHENGSFSIWRLEKSSSDAADQVRDQKHFKRAMQYARMALHHAKRALHQAKRALQHVKRALQSCNEKSSSDVTDHVMSFHTPKEQQNMPKEP